jgi:two-component sensor histidine kinase
MRSKKDVNDLVFSSNPRANEILSVILSFARLDFSKKIGLSKKNDLLDGISEGVNMLGEELKISTISLKEKEQLLKEIHHRVKNNLQIVSSLLSLQSENVLDEKYLSLIRDSRNRIASMALVHEMLYSSKSLEKIDASEYIERLSESIQRSLAGPDSKITFDYKIESGIWLDIDHIIPLGLILNEVISNSIKYGFPKQKNGKINIVMKNIGTDYSLTVGDNGVGLPKGFNIEKTSSLGMQLISMLCDQIDAKLAIKGEKGVVYRITFSA